MSGGIQLIVGLANPGQEYANTRHNAGAWFIEKIAQQFNYQLRFQGKYHGLHTLASLEKTTCHLLIPSTFMNLSGKSVQACMDYYKILPDSLLVAHDEIDLPVGTIKLKFDGGDGGHNGLKDIIRHLNTKKFYRLRIGIGRPSQQSEPVVDYVLNRPSKSDREKINALLEDALDILPLLMAGKTQQAMKNLHTDTKNDL